LKKHLLLEPFLWLRKITLFLLILLIVIGGLLYFTTNSPWVIKKVSDLASDYNISYDDISGNAFNGISIKNPNAIECFLAIRP